MTSPPPLKAGRREWIGLAVIALPCLLYAMDLTVLNLAIPAITADLKPTASQMLWIVDIYGFLVAGSLITMGTLGDRIGRRRLLMIGATAFGAASVLAALSTSAEMLIAARALLGAHCNGKKCDEQPDGQRPQAVFGPVRCDGSDMCI